MIEQKQPSLAPDRKDQAAILVGTPIAIVGVLLWENLTHTKLDTSASVAVGGVFATVMGYIWHVSTTLINRWAKL